MKHLFKTCIIGALALLAVCVAHVSPARAATCDGGAIPGMVVGGASASACYYLIPNSDGSLNVTVTPSATSGVSTQSCTVACASTLISGAHTLYGMSFSATGWVLVYDATTCSANGTVTPKKAFAYTVANSSIGVSWADTPMVNATGIAVCFSSTGPYTATASTTAFLSADYK
jgi:hypothetical protein